jgi:hypothetical protein
MIHTERATAAEKGKYRNIERHVYDEAEIGAIDRAYEQEQRRGGTSLYWEDVEEGELPQVIVKGPLTVTDVIFWHVGGNETFYNLAPLRLAWKNRQRVPSFYLPNEVGAWDAAQRCHWDDKLAQQVGNPLAYDYGAMREAWLAQFIYNWMGDQGWLWRFSCELRLFNYIGDTTWIHGSVTRKFELDGPRFGVDVELHGVNQRDATSTLGRATVLLPSRAAGRVVLPQPPHGATTIDGLLKGKIGEASGRK